MIVSTEKQCNTICYCHQEN